MKSWLIGGALDDPSGVSTEYITVSAGYARWDTVEADVYQVAPHSMTLDSFKMRLNTAPGAGKSWAFTVMKNGSPTSLSVTISDTDTTGTDTSNSVTFAAGDNFSIRSVPTSSPASPVDMQWSFVQDATDVFAMVGGSAGVAIGTNGIYISPHMGTGSSTDGDHFKFTSPIAGTLKNMYVVTGAAPGSGNSFIHTLYKNGIATSLAATVSDTNTTGNDTSNTVSISAGDEIALYLTNTGTPGSQERGVSMTFEPTTNGQSMIVAVNSQNPDDSLTEYNLVYGQRGWTTTESVAQVYMPPLDIKGFTAVMQQAPGASNSHQFVVRKNNADTEFDITISDSSTEGTDTGSVTVADEDLLAIKQVPSGTPPTNNSASFALHVEEVPVDIATAEATHSHAADSPAITQTHNIVVASSTHTHSSDSPPITQTHVVSINESLHTHTADNVTITGNFLPAENPLHVSTVVGKVDTETDVSGIG